MSALPPKADIRQREWHVRYVPISGHLQKQGATLWCAGLRRLASGLVSSRLIARLDMNKVWH